MGAADPLFTPRMMWASFLGSIAVMFAMTFIVVPDPTLEPEPVMAIALGVSALASAAMSFILPRMIAQQGLTNAEVAVKEIPDPDSSVQVTGKTPMIRVIADPREFRRKAAALYVTRFILASAMSEAVAIFGLVLHVMGAALPLTAPFFATGLVLLAIRFPTTRAMFEPLLQAKGARLLDHEPT